MPHSYVQGLLQALIRYISGGVWEPDGIIGIKTKPAVQCKCPTLYYYSSPIPHLFSSSTHESSLTPTPFMYVLAHSSL